ncbi:hypothetical protein E5676_scaffold374G00600 [Cucumis melo var. makuwa]|uniref:Uncharacterized protein n=1 Tax=Cucumis melo var. makuwa TaxID=1194695 RepID=A0A5A7T8D3_CUCMM|nr:hypothetical protein E6C27_scaffold277G001690 [Cucumis melo var. makuwa]TYK03123.1 hypothetical protein E5676_scaffold374G00600 [Cucumis melo var. makuwa]
MHALGAAHLYCRQFDELILTIKTQSSPSIDVADDDTPGAIEVIEKVPLKLLSTINDSGSRLVYQSKAFPLRVWTNCFTNKSPSVLAISHVLMK